MTKRALIFFALSLAFAASSVADDNVRAVQTKLRDGGFYFGEIDGAYSSDLAAALSRYQIRNGLPITGQLDVETSKALGAKAAVTTTAADPAQTSATWRRLRKTDQQFLAKMNAQATPAATASVSRNAPTVAAATAASPTLQTESLQSPSPEIRSTSSSPQFSVERLRDYVAAFVLAGLDPQVGAEVDFFADRVDYYNDGVMDRERIRQDLKRYDARWPERKFWLAGDIILEPKSENRVRVTFPLHFDLRNGAKHSSGKIDKTLMLEATGDDLQIVAVNERKAD